MMLDEERIREVIKNEQRITRLESMATDIQKTVPRIFQRIGEVEQKIDDFESKITKKLDDFTTSDETKATACRIALTSRIDDVDKKYFTLHEKFAKMQAGATVLYYLVAGLAIVTSILGLIHHW